MVEVQRLQTAIRLLTQSYFVQGKNFANSKVKKNRCYLLGLEMNFKNIYENVSTCCGFVAELT